MRGELILGRYRVISQLGSGGFATVQLAYDTRIQRRVAIKCLKLDGDAAAVAAGRDDVSLYDSLAIPGLEEARTAAMLQDPNIVGILDFEVQDGIAYLIMEYVDGITLGKLMDNYADSITLDVVAAVFAGVAHALEVAHGNQVLHLDIKPDNIMITHQGQIKVTDFGLAKLSSSSGYSRAAGGTIGYMPLEQMRLEQLDARCDEWALASITYEMLSGENPFEADDLDKAQMAIEDAELVLPSICMPGLDEEADDVMFYALDPEREERYDSIRDFAEELMPFLGNAKRGTKQLARIVGHAVDDTGEQVAEDDGEEGIKPIFGRRLRFFDGFGGEVLSMGTLLRAWSLVNCALIAYLACTGITWLSLAPGFVTPIVFVAICALAIVIPHIGAVVSLVALALAFASNGAYMCAILTAIPAVAWWAFVGRNGIEEPVTMMSSVSLGMFGCAGAAPLLSGLCLRAKDALINCACSAVVALALATLSSHSISGWQAVQVLPTSASRFMGSDQVLLQIFATPAFWITLASWILAVLVSAAVSGEGGSVRRTLAVILGVAILAAGLIAQAYLGSGGAEFVPGALSLVSLGAVAAIALALAWVKVE